MKKKIPYRLLFSIVGVLLGLAMCIFIGSRKEVVTYHGTIEDESDLLEINSKSKSIDEEEAKNIVAMSLWRIKNTKEFSVRTEGKSTSFGLKVSILNERIVKNGEAMITCVNKGIISNGSQRYFSNDNIYIRSTKKISKSLVPTFTDDIPEVIDNNEYINRYGWLPYQSFGYIVNSTTYKDEPIKTMNDDGTCSIDINLDMNSYAPYYYKREITINARSVEEPIFHSINLNMTIDNNYYIKNIKINEEYEVCPKDFASLGMVKTTTSVTDTYSYENIEFNQDYYNYFKNNILA